MQADCIMTSIGFSNNFNKPDRRRLYDIFAWEELQNFLLYKAGTIIFKWKKLINEVNLLMLFQPCITLKFNNNDHNTFI